MARTADQILQDTLGAQTLQIIQLMALVEQLQEKLKNETASGSPRPE